jgi:peptidoglycan-associated lipoprotein
MSLGKNKKFTGIVILSGIIAFSGLTGCAKKSEPVVEQKPVSTERPVMTPKEDGGIRMPQQISEGRTSAPMYPIYFDFDKYSIKQDMMGRIETNARFLKENPMIKVEIQGNCDERGTNEYNLALGEKRAKAARDFLVNLGVSANRIEIVSLGEESPLEPGSNEAAWTKNRRDDFVIVGK